MLDMDYSISVYLDILAAERKQAEEARSYNGLVIAWPELERQASAASTAQSAPLQTSLI